MFALLADCMRVARVLPVALVLFPLAPDGARASDRHEPVRLVAVGDLHGDYAAFEQVMSRAGLMDAAGAWIGGETVLVQTGDIAGRGPDSLAIMRRLRDLQHEAAEDGGAVIVLTGNHEAMQMTGDLRYVHEGEWAAFAGDHARERRAEYFEARRDEIAAAYRRDDAELSDEDVRARFEARVPLGYVEHREAWAPNGEVGAWVRANPVALAIGDTLFVHGGLSARYVGFTIEEMNAAAQAALDAQTRDRSAIVNDSLGPAWYRGLLRAADADPVHIGGYGPLTVEAELDRVLAAFDVDRIVVGHTPQTDAIAPLHGGQVIVIDTGMAAHYGGVNAFLEITREAVIADNDGLVTVIEAFELE